MEKRFFFGVILLILLFAIGIAAGLGMRTVHHPAEKLLEQARELALSGDLSGAIALSEQAEDRWQKSWAFTAATADHGPMDDVDQLFAELSVYARAEDTAHFAACCGQLSVLLRAMYDAHSLTLWNLL